MLQLYFAIHLAYLIGILYCEWTKIVNLIYVMFIVREQIISFKFTVNS